MATSHLSSVIPIDHQSAAVWRTSSGMAPPKAVTPVNPQSLVSRVSSEDVLDPVLQSLGDYITKTKQKFRDSNKRIEAIMTKIVAERDLGKKEDARRAKELKAENDQILIDQAECLDCVARYEQLKRSIHDTWGELLRAQVLIREHTHDH